MLERNQLRFDTPITLSTRLQPLDDDLSRLSHPKDLPNYEKSGYQLPQTVLDGAEKIGERRRRIWNMLVSTVPRSGYVPPEDRQTQILDLACGKCVEGIVLNAYFSGRGFGIPTERVHLTGIDKDPKEIELAVRRHQRENVSSDKTSLNFVLPPEYEFINGDATNLTQYPQIPQEVDVLVVRHPLYVADHSTWTQIFQQGLERLSPEGILICTNYTEFEHTEGTAMLQNIGCDVLVNKRNPYSGKDFSPNASYDRHVILAKRGK